MSWVWKAWYQVHILKFSSLLRIVDQSVSKTQFRIEKIHKSLLRSFSLTLYRMSLQATYLSITLNEASILLPLIIEAEWRICVGKLTSIGPDNGLSPGRCQAIIWTNAGILLIEPLGTNFRQILIAIQIFSFKKMQLKILSAKWHPFCLSLNVLKTSTRKYGCTCERGHSNVF